MKRRTFLTGLCASIAAFFGVGRRLPSNGDNVALAAKLDESWRSECVIQTGHCDNVWIGEVEEVSLDDLDENDFNPKYLEQQRLDQFNRLSWDEKMGFLFRPRPGAKVVHLGKVMNSREYDSFIEEFAKRKLSS